MIAPPVHLPDHPDHGLDCQEAIDAAIVAVVDRAERAGWDRRTAIAAIAALADNLMLQADAIEATDRQIARQIARPR